MFQNIAKDFEENQNTYEDVELNKKMNIKQVLKKCLSKQLGIVYLVSFLLSFVSFGMNKELAPFGMAILMATLSNCIPIGIVSILVVTGTSIAFGGQATVRVLLTLLLVFVSNLIKAPKYRISHLIENDHKSKKGNIVKGKKFISKNEEVLKQDYIKHVKEVIKNGH